MADTSGGNAISRMLKAAVGRQDSRQVLASTESEGGAEARGDVAMPGVRPESPAPDRPVESVDSYRRSTDAMRDTAKWLLTVVPVGSAILALGTVVPRLTAVETGNPEQMAALAWLGGAIASVALSLVFAARVLTAGPPGWGDVVRTMAEDSKTNELPGGSRDRRLQAEADRHGVVRLYGYRSTRDLLEGLALDDPTTAPLAVVAGNALVDFATFREVRGRFRTFLVVGGLAAVGATVSIIAATLLVAERSTPITAPTNVQLVPSNVGLEVLSEAGCAPTDGRVDAVAVSGTWNEPTVVIDDALDHCDPVGLEWKGHWGSVVPLL